MLARFLGLILPGVVLLSHVGAQQDPSPGTPTQGQPQLEVVARDVPLLGFSIHLPENSEVQRQQTPSGLTYQFLPRPIPAPSLEDPNATLRPWTIRAQVVQGSTPGMTGPQLVTELITAQQQSGANLTELARTQIVVDNQLSCTLSYFEQQLPNSTSVIWGYVAIPIRENHFLLMSLLFSPTTYQPYRSLLERSLATIKRTSKAGTSLGLRACMSRGELFLSSLTAERLQTLVGLRQWVRIYRPATGANGTDQELGYALLNIEEGSKAAVQSGDTQVGQDQGLLVTVQARLVVDAQRSIYRDSIGLYWMAWDQSEEIWSVRGTQRQGAAEISEAESGLRVARTTGNPRPELIVIRAGRESNTRTPSRWTLPEVYLSQPLGWILGRLLPTTPDAEGEYCYYFYDYTSESPSLSRRLDHWAPAQDGTGQWVLTSRLSPTATTSTARYDADGTLIEQRTADGVVTVPTTSAELDRIWQAKKLRR